MKARIFEPFQKVWTPRTPDSNYDSLGAPLPPPVVMVPLLVASIGTGVIFEQGFYVSPIQSRNASASSGVGLTLQSASYTKPAVAAVQAMTAAALA
jgi:hypothetical protein